MELTDLPETGTIDLTTIGRRSGAERTVEIWYVVHDGRLHVVGTPGRRSWLANVVADPRVRLRIGDETVEALASRVDDPAERARVTDTAWRVRPWYAERGRSREEWVAGAPMVVLEVVSTEASAGPGGPTA